ncbi:hypothetical protein BDQ17DRAFT_1435688 [Cyathus striatus]|nr:hypothetical protein BDQ17DRAFT_1435688 [Cyathus striatus]
MARDQSSPLPQQAHQAPISSSVASSIAQAGSSSRQTPPPSSATSSSTLPGPSQSTSSPDLSSTAVNWTSQQWSDKLQQRDNEIVRLRQLLAATEHPLENINTADGQADTVQPPVTILFLPGLVIRHSYLPSVSYLLVMKPPISSSSYDSFRVIVPFLSVGHIIAILAPRLFLGHHPILFVRHIIICLCVSSRVDDAFLNWEYVPYTALTHSARVKSSKGEEEFFINGKGGLSAKTLERATEKDISLEDRLCASKIAVELERVHVHHGIGRASALERPTFLLPFFSHFRDHNEAGLGTFGPPNMVI